MSNVDKLKKKAAEFEQKKQFDRALEVYLQIVGQYGPADEKDVTVYNRIGDLYLRLNKPDKAVEYYEQAVDLYTEGGYLNNAIALCNKILRHAPSRHLIYYKLGKISAKKGFNSDAKKNFLEYADRMHRAGKDTDAFKALQEFADLCPGQDDIRLMLADQLAKAGKTKEAVEQLQILHESLDAEGRVAEAEATVQRLHSLDPSVEPRRSRTPRTNDSGGLVFLDLGGSPPKSRPKISGLQPTALAPEPPPRPRTPQHVQPLPEFEALPDIELEDLPEIELEPLESDEIPGLERGASAAQAEARAEPEIEPAFNLEVEELEISPLEGLESAADPSQFAITPEASPDEAPPVDGLMVSDAGLGEPLVDEDPLSGLSVLEDDRYFTSDANPLAGLMDETEPSPSQAHAFAPEPKEPTPAKPVPRTERPDPEILKMPEPEAERALEPMDFQVEPPTPAPHSKPATPARGRTAARPAAPPAAPVEEEDEEEEEQEIEAYSEPEPEPEAEQEPEPEPEPEPVKPSRPKLVQPVRPTRPKKMKQPEPEPAREPERQHVNPFQRQRANKLKPKEPSPLASPRLSTPPAEIPRAATPKENAPASTDDNFVNLADWLREDAGPRSYRMVAEEDHNREGDEQADFTDMLEKFKAGVAANVDDGDYDAHYDLGIAYKEMGLIDEAIAEFQKALRGATQRIRAYEALGQCFIDRKEYDVAITVLSRSLREQGMEDEDLIGVLYLLGYASEQSRKPRDASAYYQRVFAIDIDFRDVSKRLKSMSKAASK